MIDRVDRSVEQIVDEILVMDCQSGRVKALEILVCRWQKRLWRYAFHLAGDSEAAWDITQESWLGMIRGISRSHVSGQCQIDEKKRQVSIFPHGLAFFSGWAQKIL